MDFNLASLDGQWHDVIQQITGFNPYSKGLRGQNQPCPLCGGENRFSYTNTHNNGTWLCRQCTPEGSTGFGLISKILGLDNKETFKTIAKLYSSESFNSTPYQKHDPAPEFTKTQPLDDWDMKTLINKPGKQYDFKHIWKWRDHNGAEYGYVARLEFFDDNQERVKMAWQVHHGTQGDETGWFQVSIKPKPLFGYAACGLNHDYKQVILCEGEKTCMALKKLLNSPDYLVLCCQGGAAQVKSTDFTLLINYAKDLPVYIWPDNDDTGYQHAKELTEIFPQAQVFNSSVLEDIGCKYSPEHGEDAADIDSLDVGQLQQLIDSAYKIHIETVTVAKENKNNLDEFLRHVNPMGVHEGKYVFYPKNLKCLQFIPVGMLLSTPTMLSIVGKDMLFKHFPKTIDDEGAENDGEVIGFEARKAAEFLLEECHKRGTYNPDLMRGVGVWKESSKVVINTGVDLIVDKVRIPYDDFETEYTYAQPGKEVVQIDDVATETDLEVVKNIIYGFNWSRQHHAHLMLGLLVQAPIASALRWRAHGWIIGAQGTGKSTLQSSFIRPLLGDLCINFGGETTAAGVRQALKNNPYCVSFDEAEVRSEKDAKRMKDIISLARISSSDENNVVKGSASGDAMEYSCCSPFLMSSIKPYLREESDIARFAQLELEQPGMTEADREAFKLVQLNCLAVDKAFSKRWIAFCINSLSKIADNMLVIKAELIKLGVSPRVIDQYGQLIACAMVVNPDIDIADFNETLEEAKEHTSDTEALHALNKLLGHEIRIPGKFGDKFVPISEAVEISSKSLDVFHDFNVEDVHRRINKLGLKVQDRYLYIANNSDAIESILGYPDYNKLFKIIRGAEAGDNNTTFGSRTYKSRYVKIALRLIEYCDTDSDEDNSDGPGVFEGGHYSGVIHFGNQKPSADAGF